MVVYRAASTRLPPVSKNDPTCLGEKKIVCKIFVLEYHHLAQNTRRENWKLGTKGKGKNYKEKEVATTIYMFPFTVQDSCYMTLLNRTQQNYIATLLLRLLEFPRYNIPAKPDPTASRCNLQRFLQLANI